MGKGSWIIVNSASDMSVLTKKQGQLEYLVAEGIHVPHCFTTRLGGVSTGYLASLNLGLRRGDDPENVGNIWF